MVPIMIQNLCNANTFNGMGFLSTNFMFTLPLQGKTLCQGHNSHLTEGELKFKLIMLVKGHLRLSYVRLQEACGYFMIMK